MSILRILKLKIRLVYFLPLFAVLLYLKAPRNGCDLNSDPFVKPGAGSKPPSPIGLANAVILVLCRNSDLEGMRRTLRQFEDRFNRRFNYPYLFLNDQEFDSAFKRGIEYEASSNVTFAKIHEKDWEMPAWIDKALAAERMKEMAANGVPYAEAISYHNMCRYQSGKVFSHPALASYDYYWRIEPDTHFYCDVNYDPLKWMIENNKLYGFTIALKEVEKSIPSLLRHTLEFMRNYSRPLETDLFPFFLDPLESAKKETPGADLALDSRTGKSASAGLQRYNLCHFWTNFEIASLSLFRSREYQDYFEHLDKTGNFYYERWGDAPIHSLGLAMLLNKDRVHWFEDIGYRHADFSVCSSNGLADPTAPYRCHCPMPNQGSFYGDEGSCLPRFSNYSPSKLDLKNLVVDGSGLLP